MPDNVRPVSPLDHGISKGCVIHAGLVFEGHLDIERLELSAEKLVAEYPELNVVLKRKLPSVSDPLPCPHIGTDTILKAGEAKHPCCNISSVELSR